MSVCIIIMSVYSESALDALDGIALCLYYGYSPQQGSIVLNSADFNVNASLSNKSEQKLRSLNRTHVGLDVHAALTRGSSFIPIHHMWTFTRSGIPPPSPKLQN